MIHRCVAIIMVREIDRDRERNSFERDREREMVRGRYVNYTRSRLSHHEEQCSTVQELLK